jgi:hypothetical protein
MEHNCLDHLIARVSHDQYPERTVEVEYDECSVCHEKYSPEETRAMWEAEAQHA